MRLSCPNCLTAYDIPDDALAGRARTLRCAHCGHQWRHPAAAVEEAPAASEAPPAAGPDQIAPVAPVAAQAASEPLIDAPPLTPPPSTPHSGPAANRPATAQVAANARRVAPVKTTSPRRGRAPAWIILALILLAVVLIAAHRPISHNWPATIPFYKALGLK